MNRLKTLWEHRAGPLAVCYLLAAVVWLVNGVGAVAGDAIARAGGKLAEQSLTAADFALVDLQPLDAATDPATGEAVEPLLTLTGDPQMILEDVSDRTVRTLQIWAEYDGEPREMCLYYTTKAGQDYSQDRRVFPVQQPDGSALYTLPRGRIVALRLDPCSPDEGKQVTIRLHKVALNSGLFWAEPLVPSWYELFCLVLFPAMAAAALDWLRAVRRRAVA